MKILKFTKEVKFGDYEFIIKKLAAGENLEIQTNAFKFKDNVDLTKIKDDNVGASVITDTATLRLMTVSKSIIKWNIEADESVPENTKFLEINLENVKLLPNDVFTELEREIKAINKAPSKGEVKN
ncbi:MAG TPA: hypothetical protein PKK26_03800 [Candidatus Wallbacteria bacterium]|nr:hypothetical protein [Candidatus Wallbacteria bacterium]